jgi:hypothetical protein
MIPAGFNDQPEAGASPQLKLVAETNSPKGQFLYRAQRGYTTIFTSAVDLGIIVPAVYLAGILLWRRSPPGALLSFILLMPLAGVGINVVRQTLFQLSLVISYSPDRLIGMIASRFILVCLRPALAYPSCIIFQIAK